MSSVSRRVCRAPKHQTIRRLIVKNGDDHTITELDGRGWIRAKEQKNDAQPEQTRSVPNSEVVTESDLSTVSSVRSDSPSGIWDGNPGIEWGEPWPSVCFPFQ
jgi:hypothetical protein